ncbi:MAG: hypothetical protein LBQ90_06665 [Synergistaceae bacterium]|nr:hypothetical protein [Synergistaceae bacterium]
MPGFKAHGPRILLVLLFVLAACFLSSAFFPREAAGAGDSAEAFMSATFGLSSARTQKRMEKSGAVASDFVREGRLTMKGTFEFRSAVFVFGFHAKNGLNHKAVYIASSGNAEEDRALYDALREAYNVRFGKTNERPATNARTKNRIMLQSNWKPDKYTIIALSCNTGATNRFPGDSPGARPIHLIYNFTKWTK